MTNLNQHFFDSIQQARNVTPPRTFQACRFHPAPRFTSPSAGFCPTHVAKPSPRSGFNQFNPSMSKKSIPKSSLAVELENQATEGILELSVTEVTQSRPTACSFFMYVCIRTVYYKRFLHPVFPQSFYFSHETSTPFLPAPVSSHRIRSLSLELPWVHGWSCVFSLRPWFLSRHRGLQFGLQICLARTGSPSKAGIWVWVKTY